MRNRKTAKYAELTHYCSLLLIIAEFDEFLLAQSGFLTQRNVTIGLKPSIIGLNLQVRPAQVLFLDYLTLWYRA